ncbi:hypothetical protein KGF54_001095 [Candida jiufengensis]|uniref:uncharacterized protein n=1 Tax=Candida jiufengensis TaxID=497108 RepID=UPI0022244353|nr:uncharacterized protein KGF54_001095 [Candida jiufengensis]KAI5955593.1 hypothetical protein KGF54_001095 [Candida jiufengensis]
MSLIFQLLITLVFILKFCLGLNDSYSNLVDQLIEGKLNVYEEQPSTNLTIDWEYKDENISLVIDMISLDNGELLIKIYNLLQQALANKQYLDAIVLYDFIVRNGYVGSYLNGEQDKELAFSIIKLDLTNS